MPCETSSISFGPAAPFAKVMHSSSTGSDNGVGSHSQSRPATMAVYNHQPDSRPVSVIINIVIQYSLLSTLPSYTTSHHRRQAATRRREVQQPSIERTQKNQKSRGCLGPRSAIPQFLSCGGGEEKRGVRTSRGGNVK